MLSNPNPHLELHQPTHVVKNRVKRMRLKGLPQFVVTRGGEYCFLPGIRALRWLGDLKA